MARPRKTTAVLESTDECNRAMRALLITTLDLEKETAVRDGAVAAVMKDHEKRMQRLADKKTDLELQLQNYYMSHIGDFEKGDKKSANLQYGVLGRRKGKPSLRLLNRSWTWSAVLVKLKEKFGKRFIRMSEPEVNKDLVKAEIGEDELKLYGMKLQQSENFFVDLFRPDEPDGAVADAGKKAGA